MIKGINDFCNKHLKVERLKPALAGGAISCAASLYHWNRLSSETSYHPATLTIGGITIAALQGMAIHKFSDKEFWRESPNFLAAATCIIIEQPALWFIDKKPLAILASIVAQIGCHLLIGIAAPHADDILRQQFLIDNGRSKTWIRFAKMVTQVCLTRYFSSSLPNESLADIAAIRQGFFIVSSYYLPVLLGLSHRIPNVSIAPINPQRISNIILLQKDQTISVTQEPGNISLAPFQHGQGISIYQENGDVAHAVQVIPISEEVASQFSLPPAPDDPIQFIASRMQAVQETHANAGSPLDPNGSFATVTALLAGFSSRSESPVYIGEDGEVYHEPKWRGVSAAFAIMEPYEKKGQFAGMSAALRRFRDGQMCTIFCLKKSEEQKNYECMMHKLSRLPLVAKGYQAMNDMAEFISFQNKVALELKSELEKHLDEWQVDRIEVEGTKEGLEKRKQNIGDASWAIRVLIFHKKVEQAHEAAVEDL